MNEWLKPDNPATRKARELLRPHFEKRNFDKVDMKTWNNYLYCQNCRAKKDMTKYHKRDMTHIYRKYVKGGKIYHVYMHLCEKHAENYNPRDNRKGNINE